MARVVVIGAGVIGLSTAINIQQSLPGVHVSLMAEKFDRYTTSIGAGAIIFPSATGIDDVTRRKWGHSSMGYFTELAASEDSCESGASLTMGMIYSSKPETPDYGEFMLTCNPIPPATAEKLYLGKYHCFIVTTVMVEMKRYMPWLMKRFKQLGGDVIERRVDTFEQFVGAYDLVVNCTGLGARELTGDDKLIPVRGQVLRVSAPWVKHFLGYSSLEGEHQPMFYPNSDNVVVGAVKQPGRTDTQISPHTAETIWNETAAFWPPLKPAKVLWEWSGIRPHREPPRVESELIRYGDKTLKVVHNYGHGQFGVSLSWGTAVHATELAKKLLAQSAKL